MRRAVLLLLLAPPAAAQELPLPALAPLNPVTLSRSAMGAPGFVQRGDGWQLHLAFDYGSAAEVDRTAAGEYVLDAELFRFAATVRRDIGDSWFVALRTGIAGAHDGVADAFFDTFHDVIGHDHDARDSRPRNRYAYHIATAEQRIEHTRRYVATGDTDLSLGRRHTSWLQSQATLTLPTSSAPAPLRRSVPAGAVMTTLRARPHARAAIELSGGAGYAPAHGSLATRQRTTHHAASAGVAIGIVEGLSAWGRLFHHSRVHDRTGFNELDGGELSIDFGLALCRSRGTLRSWYVGLVEDTRLTDGAIDLVLRIGASTQ